MKKIIISIFVLIFMTLGGFAQDKKVEIGLQVGYGYDMPKPANDTVLNSNGFYGGPIVKFKINETFGIQTGILYNYYSATNLMSSLSVKNLTGVWTQFRNTSQYLDFPIKMSYTVPLADEFSIDLLVGPNLNVGLNRKVYYDSYADNKLLVGYPHIVKDYYSQTSDILPLDVQFGIGAAIYYNHFSVRAGYDWGLLDRDKSANTLKGNNIKIGLAYTF